MAKLFVLFVMSMWCALSWAGPCAPASGSPYIYHYDYGTKTITNPDENKAGTFYPDAYTWNLGGDYPVTCSCSASYTSTYFTTTTTLPMGHYGNGLQFFKVNDYLEVATEVYIAGTLHIYKPTPLTAFSNQQNWSPACNTPINYSTGSSGKLSLYLTKSFIGSTSFSATVFSIYGTTTPNDPIGPVALSVVSISGNVVVPQNCVINAGQTVVVDFGTLLSADFKTAGQKPNGFTDKSFNVPIKCTNIGASVNLKLTIQATPTPQYTQAIASDNPDVGIEVTNSQGTVLTPNDINSIIPFITDSSGNAEVTLKAYPISTTGKAPAEGVFTALATLRIDFA
ncbi:fimbrial protein [Atlantibacter subterranea]|uniref:Fimbrial protein n=1 Tax=Atlantibacter subterraneus TaxID=255519 RepID=A0A3R9LK91_9ENTR|nr:fimbrial protein [Atlantibacter subterranea]MDA3131347.1 fimbrial protein [Atlantibacter subterranea]MDW2740979.1 fimbrial protein [Atlantibacter subterranea]RSB61042.1 fimbrial protein [Atlantibacter subterranea]RSE05488.1 fimbrial protein [Atlantibacter subterranea]RSE23857.1 fimbrial protein [Atlantibacter subterranea]